MCFKNFEGKPERENPKRTIFANGRLGLLQIVSKSGTGWCASKDAELRRGVDYEISHRFEWGTSANEDTGRVDYCEIPHRLERVTKHSL